MRDKTSGKLGIYAGFLCESSNDNSYWHKSTDYTRSIIWLNTTFDTSLELEFEFRDIII